VLDTSVWVSAYGQVFFSLSLAMGVMMTYSSYLPDKTDINNSAFMTAFANCGFEFLAAIGVFGILGYMATVNGVEVDGVATQSIGLAFVAFPGVFNAMGSFGRFFGVLFFICLIFAGLTSSISLIEAFSSAVIDKTGISRRKIVTLASFIGYFISIIYATGAGLYFLDIIDAFINAYGVIVVALIESVLVGWLLGPRLIREHTNAISYYSIGRWWDFMIKFVTPLALIYMIIQSLLNEISNPYGGYPMKAIVLFGWGTIAVGLVCSYLFSKRPWYEGRLSVESEIKGRRGK